ncbi:hypothetical protein BVIET440_180125 [Burkholderia vietnamiensis]
MIFISVDLPAPFSPISACTVPRRTRNCTPSSATTPGKDLPTPRTSSRQSDAAAAGPADAGADAAGALSLAIERAILAVNMDVPRKSHARPDRPGTRNSAEKPVSASRTGSCCRG